MCPVDNEADIIGVSYPISNWLAFDVMDFPIAIQYTAAVVL